MVLVHFFWGILSLTSAFSHAAQEVPFGDEPKTECEFVLTHPQEASVIMKWLADLVGSIREGAIAYEDRSPKPKAIEALGLITPLPKDAKMSIEKANENIYWIRLTGSWGEIKSFKLQVPPVVIWKAVDWEENISELDLSLKSEDKKKLTVGTATSNAALRQFITFSIIHDGFVTVQIGLDVDCKRSSEYTNSVVPQIVLPPEGHVPNQLCRIGVVMAHFKI